MNILFLGSIINEKDLVGLSGGSFAGNNMQLSILSELNKLKDTNVNALSILSIAGFPNDSTLYSKSSFMEINGVITHQIPFVNIPIVKQIWQAFSLYKYTKLAIREEKIDILLSYNLYPQIGYSVNKVFNSKKIPTVTILADLPLEDNIKRNLLTRIVMRIFNKATINIIKSCNNYIVLNKNVLKEYNLDKEFIVIDGGINENKIPNGKITYANRKKTILYSGALTEYSGILNLIEAMKMLANKDAILKIYGNGPLENRVKAESDLSSNVQYCGYTDNDTILTEQQCAYLLVNPRHTDDPISKVTFPSKIFEYLVSGTVVLSTRLNGFDEQYEDKLFFVESSNAEKLSNRIDDILALDIDFLEKKAEKARKFIKENKTWNIQVKQIYQFMNDLI